MPPKTRTFSGGEAARSQDPEDAAAAAGQESHVMQIVETIEQGNAQLPQASTQTTGPEEPTPQAGSDAGILAYYDEIPCLCWDSSC